MRPGPIPRRGRRRSFRVERGEGGPGVGDQAHRGGDRCPDLVRVYVYLDHGLVPARDGVALGGHLAQPASDHEDEVSLLQGV